MKKYLILLLLVCCKKENDNLSPNNTFTGVSQHNLEISITHPQKFCTNSASGFTHTVGLGYSSTDIANNAFFDKRQGDKSGAIYTFTLKDGLYYYKGIACCTGCNEQSCSGLGYSAGGCKSSSGSIEIKSDKVVQINI